VLILLPGVEPKSTLTTWTKPLPVTVIVAPPATAPEADDNLAGPGRAGPRARLPLLRRSPRT
jgi:hypothetical protein